MFISILLFLPPFLSGKQIFSKKDLFILLLIPVKQNILLQKVSHVKRKTH